MRAEGEAGLAHLAHDRGVILHGAPDEKERRGDAVGDQVAQQRRRGRPGAIVERQRDLVALAAAAGHVGRVAQHGVDRPVGRGEAEIILAPWRRHARRCASIRSGRRVAGTRAVEGQQDDRDDRDDRAEGRQPATLVYPSVGLAPGPKLLWAVSLDVRISSSDATCSTTHDRPRLGGHATPAPWRPVCLQGFADRA